jgi:hypothetical protein
MNSENWKLQKAKGRAGFIVQKKRRNAACDGMGGVCIHKKEIPWT